VSMSRLVRLSQSAERHGNISAISQTLKCAKTHTQRSMEVLSVHAEGGSLPKHPGAIKAPRAMIIIANE
jgi:hypothetical protein